MSKGSLFFLIAFIIAAFLAGFFFLQTQEKQKVLDTHLAALSDAQTAFDQSSEALENANQEIENKAQQKAEALNRAQERETQKKLAEEAARMAAFKSQQEELEKQKKWAELNKQLEKEAQAREAAEKATVELGKQIERLEKAMAYVAQQQTDLLQQRLKEESHLEKEYQALIHEINKRKEDLRKLAQEQQRLKASREDALSRQIKIEEEILNTGGKITINNYRIWSPNYRPRQ